MEAAILPSRTVRPDAASTPHEADANVTAQDPARGDHRRMQTFEIVPRGPFSLEAAQSFAGGFAAGIGGGETTQRGIVMAFPVEGWTTSAAADVSQTPDGVVHVRFESTAPVSADSVHRQVARCLSLDHDGSGWPAVGERDPVIGRLQRRHDYLRPVCFYSAYEAVTSFVIGQRIARRQSARIKAWLGEQLGDRLTLDGTTHFAFPRPQRLLELKDAPGLNAVKVDRLHGLAEAALDGRLDTERLRALPVERAMDELMMLNGVGGFTAEGTILRGCGVVDEIPRDPLNRDAIAELYGVGSIDDATWTEITDRWRPYRMWATVLLRVGWEREQPGRSYRHRPE
jgi:DNA-3-methyladenine glycosylase II